MNYLRHQTKEQVIYFNSYIFKINGARLNLNNYNLFKDTNIYAYNNNLNA